MPLYTEDLCLIETLFSYSYFNLQEQILLEVWITEQS